MLATGDVQVSGVQCNAGLAMVFSPWAKYVAQTIALLACMTLRFILREVCEARLSQN